MDDSTLHKPVMVDEVIRFLGIKKGLKVLDATVGCGGHASFILQKIKPDGHLIGIDCDKSSLEIADIRLNRFKKICKLIHANFRDIDRVLLSSGIAKIDACLFDLGMSSYQIGDASRGFSFERDGFLDMRMDQSNPLRAYDIVNKYRKEDLERIIHDFGQERYYKRIVGFILERRRKSPISSTRELSELIEKAVGKRYKFQRIHPATRTFQALRIAINEELESLNQALDKVSDFLSSRGRVGVISFHSLEDRIVKMRFKEFEKDQRGHIITKKPLTPTSDEKDENPRSRSAKLRVFEITG